MMEVRELTDQDHEVLGAEYCSGYTDIFGKWNTGFYCPSMGNGETVYCCGTVTYKYCCTRRDQQQTSTGLSQAVILGSALGSVLVLVLVTVVSCLVCRRCIPYRRAHTSLSGGPLYNMHCSSTASGVTNMYSFSGQTTAATTPLDANGDPHHDLVDLDSSSTQHRPYAQHRGFGLLPADPPPPYNDMLNQEASHLREPSAITNSTSSFTPHMPSGHHHQHHHRASPGASASSGSHFHHHHHQSPSASSNDFCNTQENLYRSTKF